MILIHFLTEYLLNLFFKLKILVTKGSHFTHCLVLSGKTKTKQLAFLFIIFMLFSSSCKKANQADPETHNPPLDNTWGTKPSVNSNVIIVSKDTIQHSLVKVDSATLTFTTGGPGLDRVKPGIILVSDHIPLAPFGFLRRVTSIKNTGGFLICTTDQAILTDAITEGSFSINKTFTSDDVVQQDTTGQSGNAFHLRVLGGPNSGGNIVISLNHVYDDDGNVATKDDQTTITGSISLGVKLNFNILISKAKLQHALADVVLTKSVNINVSRPVSTKTSAHEIQLGSVYLGTITADIGVPVVLVTKLVFVLGIDGDITAKITTGVSALETSELGITYDNGTWTGLKTQSNTFNFQPPTFDISGRVAPYAQVKYQILPYNISNFGIFKSDIYLGDKVTLAAEATANPNSGISASLQWLVGFNAVAHLSLFGNSVIDYDQTFLSATYPIWSKDYNIPTLSTTDVTVITQTSASSGGNISASGGLTVTDRGVCWSISSTPTINSSKIQSGTGIGSFTSSLTGLQAGTKYYYCAYATNSAGTAYGIIKSFTTSAATQNPPVNPGNPANPGSGGSSGNSGPQSVPAIGQYSNCVAAATSSCSPLVQYSEGTVNAQIMSIDKVNHQITFLLKKCSGTTFSAGGHINIVSDLCSGVSYGFVAFNSGGLTIQATVTDASMSGTKTYHPFIVQQVGSTTIQYDAPAIVVTY